jgi:acyl dehydratase
VSPGGLDLGAVGRDSGAFESDWTARDALLYAVGVGAGQEDATAELAFTTENSTGITHRVVPTFAIAVGLGRLPDLGQVSLAQILHAEQEVAVHRELPTAGRAHSTTRVAAIYDKGKGALVRLKTEVIDSKDDMALATLTSGLFIRGAGGWGGDRGPQRQWALPEGQADAVCRYRTSPGQALIYRLSGDRNPLHSDPAAAAAAGFPGPILHGLCTYGYTGRALVDVVCEGDPGRFGEMRARFSTPVLPGQELEVGIWLTDGGAAFRTTTDAGTVIDHGSFSLAGQGLHREPRHP